MSNFANPENDAYILRCILSSGTSTLPSIVFSNDLTKGLYWNLAGLHLTGLSATPTDNTEAASKAYVDAQSGGGGATTALDNLASVAINLSLTPGVDDSIDLDSVSKRYKNAWFSGVIQAAQGTTSNPSIALGFSDTGFCTVGATHAFRLVAATQTVATINTNGMEFGTDMQLIINNGMTGGRLPLAFDPSAHTGLSGDDNSINLVANNTVGLTVNGSNVTFNLSPIPTVNDSRILGSSSFKWHQVWSTSINSGELLSLSSDVSITLPDDGTIHLNAPGTLTGMVISSLGTQLIADGSSASLFGDTAGLGLFDTSSESGGSVILDSGAVYLSSDGGGTISGQFDGDSTASNTRFMLWDVDSGALQRVSVGVADSGGTGFKVLRIPN